ncbi:MAG: hypothetical protein A2Y25_01675 [Candidatus Melainabacteria bacterium GWF2_37_15]|nr:MAG: hypothetical protein A2Y25_01675 [Candidatus Melainabacteria bacterium GWF2_37_15]
MEKSLLTTGKNQNNVLELCKNSSENIVLMPAGQQSIHFAKYLKKHSINIEFFVDNNPQKHGIFINDIPVISFDEYKKVNNKKFLIISTNKYIEQEIINQLKKNEIKNYECSIADYICYTSNEIDNARELMEKNWESYSKLYNMLEDNISKKTLINRLNYLISYNKDFLKEIMQLPEKQYFEPEIYKITSNDYFVDCGAFDGDTLNNLMNNVNFEIAGYYGFEPDNVNYEQLCKKAKQYKNTSIINKGIYKEDTTLKFNSTNNSSAQLNENGNIEIKVTSLDNFFKDKKVSFIKMDIEGGEKDAILGAKDLIKEQKPVLAISVYHKFKDIYELPFLIHSFNVKYRYYLRHYTSCSSETIFYAVPEE